MHADYTALNEGLIVILESSETRVSKEFAMKNR